MDTDVVSYILTFCRNSYLFVATVDKTWNKAYPFTNKQTAIESAVSSSMTTRCALPALRANATLNSAAFFYASKLGNLEVLSLLLANKRPQGLYTCAVGAVAGGKPDPLSWTVANEFCIDRFVCYQSSANGNVEMLQRAVELGCPWDTERCIFIAKKKRNDAVVAWINQSTC